MNRLTRFAALAMLGLGVVLVSGNALAQNERRPLQTDPVVAPGTTYARPHAPAGSLAEIPVWKRITLGSHQGVNALRNALDAARVHVGDSAGEILGRPAFQFSPTRMDVDLVVVSVSELGFEDSTPLADIYRRAGELGLELCPAEVAPLLRLHYVNQPISEFLNVAMRPIATYGGDLNRLERGDRRHRAPSPGRRWTP